MRVEWAADVRVWDALAPAPASNDGAEVPGSPSRRGPARDVPTDRGLRRGWFTALGWAPDHRPGGRTALECAIPPRPANPPTPSPLWSIRRRAAEFHRRRGGAGLWPGREWGLRKEIPAAGHDAIVRYGLAALAEHAGVAVAPRFGSGTRSRKVRQNRKMTVARMPGAVHDRKAAGAQH